MSRTRRKTSCATRIGTRTTCSKRSRISCSHQSTVQRLVLGSRGTIVLAHDGFIDSINDSVGLGFGADWTRDNTWVPIVTQWNFWLSTHWSVFGEPGGAFHFTDDGRRDRADFTLYGGARLRFSDRVTLTFRVGHRALAVGLSFLL